MDEAFGGSTVEKNLDFPVLDFGGLGVLRVLGSLQGGPEAGASGAVACVGLTAQADALFRTLDIRQFGSLDPSGFWTTATFKFDEKFSGKYRRNERPHQEACG
jgi:hypothetical protein